MRRNPQGQFVGGESMDEFVDRPFAAFTTIGARHRGQRVLVINHGGVLDVLIRHISDRPRHAILRAKPKNGECVWIEVAEHCITARRG